MIRSIIVDDEDHAIESLAILLKKYCPEIEVIDSATNILDAIKKINRHKPDLVFLDVSMPSGSGFDLLDTLGEIHFQFIFVTAFENYAINALRRNALDYLIKPIDATELKNAISKVNLNTTTTNHISALSNTRLCLPVADGVEFVQYDEIIHLEAEGNYVKIHTTTHKNPIIIAKTLKELESKLSTQFFIRCHRSHIVSIQKIRKYNKADGGHLVLSNGNHVPLSGSRKIDFTDFI